MTDNEMIDIYKLIEEYHKKYLEPCGVKLPKFGTKDALVLIRLVQYYPNTETLTKEDLTKFVNKHSSDNSIDMQQARHLAAQKGWNIISGTRGEITNIKIPSGSYKLISLETPHPSFIKNRRTGVLSDDFEELKKEYNYKCASCGSEEGKEHLKRKGTLTQLQQGHMDPKKDLVAGNIIPQCQICNRADRNKWIFDKTGRVIQVANTEDGFRIVMKFIENATKQVKESIYKELEKLLKK